MTDQQINSETRLRLYRQQGWDLRKARLRLTKWVAWLLIGHGGGDLTKNPAICTHRYSEDASCSFPALSYDLISSSRFEA